MLNMRAMYYNRSMSKRRVFAKAGFMLAVYVGLHMLVPAVALAEETFSLSPIIVDEKAKQRDILKQTVTITNTTDRKLQIYATVMNMDVANGAQQFQNRYEADIATSIANWIEITRGVIELEPGETKRIPYLIQVYLSAAPGVYHAKIFFQEGSNRDEAEQRIKAWKDVDINLEVLDDAKERLQLNTFTPDKVFFTGANASFSYLLENVGNRPLTPKGEIRIFNRRGEEVGTIPANSENTALLPEATSQLSAAWNTAGKFGRYKAYLDIAYGDKQTGTVNDTIFFWVVPWKEILLLFVVLAGAIAFLGYIVYDRYGFNKKRMAYAVVGGDAYAAPQAVDHFSHERAPLFTPQTAVSVNTSPSVLRARPGAAAQEAPRQRAVTAQPLVRQQSYSNEAVRLEPRKKQEPPAGAVVSLKKR